MRISPAIALPRVFMAAKPITVPLARTARPATRSILIPSWAIVKATTRKIRPHLRIFFKRKDTVSSSLPRPLSLVICLEEKL